MFMLIEQPHIKRSNTGVAEFKRGRAILEDEPRPGGLVEVINDPTRENMSVGCERQGNESVKTVQGIRHFRR